MPTRIIRDLYSGQLKEVASEGGGRKIIARETVGYQPGRKTNAYDRAWKSEALAVPVEQLSAFNEGVARGARYVPDGKGYAHLECDSRQARASEMKRRGVFDRDAGYSDYAGAF